MDVDALVAAGSPVATATLDTLDLHGADVALFEEILATAIATPHVLPLAPSRPRRRHAVRETAFALVVVATAAAGLATLHARTGQVAKPGTEDRGGEYIRLDAPDINKIVDDIGKDIPLPPGGSFDGWKRRWSTAIAKDGRPSGMSDSTLETSLSLDAACQWTGYWLDAHTRGDEAAEAKAVPVLEAIPEWPAIERSAGDAEFLLLLRRRAAGARAGEPSLFEAEYRYNCPQGGSR